MDVWVRDLALRDRFPRLFVVSNKQETVVRNFDKWIGDKSVSEFTQRRVLLVLEHELVFGYYGWRGFYIGRGGQMVFGE